MKTIEDQEIVDCKTCGTAVAFESSGDLREYDICDSCEGKFCPDCFGGDPLEKNLCRQCTKSPPTEE